MNRYLTILSAAICVAASFVGSASAADVDRSSNERLVCVAETTGDRPQDVSDFISPAWREMDAAVKNLSEPVSDIAPLLAGDAGSVASTDMTALSVPEIPLPLNVIPGFVGIGFVLLMHRRSLNRGKLSR